MQILYLGSEKRHSTSCHRAETLRRLGHDVMHLDPMRGLPDSFLIGGFSLRIGFELFSPFVAKFVKNKIGQRMFDIAWVDGCPELNTITYKWLKTKCGLIINYNVDDPFGSRDRRKWSQYKKAVNFHDLTVVVRKENIEEALELGSKNVLRVFRSYDPVEHNAISINDRDYKDWSSEVIFVGTWMPERGPFLSTLLENGIPLTIRGNLWNKAPEWGKLKAAWKGPAVYGRDYVKAIHCGKIALGLLSKGNRDLHTQRSSEAPFIGGAAFCAEWTTEHEEMFINRENVMLWRNAQECCEMCRALLRDELTRQKISELGHSSIVSLGLSNDVVMYNILSTVGVESPNKPEIADSFGLKFESCE